MGLLPLDMDILPPSDDRVFKLILTSPEAKPGLINFINRKCCKIAVGGKIKRASSAPDYAMIGAA